MKKLLLFAAIAVIAFGCGQTTGYTIAGDIEGLEASTVYLFDDSAELIGSAKVSNGKFRFEGSAEEPSVAFMGQNESFGYPFVVFILENGEIKIEGNIDDKIVAAGTKANDRSNEYDAAHIEIMKKLEAANTDEELELIFAEYRDCMSSTIDSDTDNYFGLFLLDSYSNTADTEVDDILAKLDKFTPEMQNTKLGREIRTKAEAKKQMIGIGQPYKDIVLPDREGNKLALSSYVGEGKYVLLVFWASWCGPCMMQVPYLKDAYETYHAKGFEIYAVSLDRGDRAEKEGLDAVDKHNMDWIKVALFKEPDNSAPIDYSITTIPANFLISPEGIIIAKNLYGEQIKEELSKYIE